MPSCLTFISTSAIQTKYLGNLLGKNLSADTCIGLSGELGSGKTCLVQGIVAGLGGDEKSVTSPSYTLVNQYPTAGGIVYHSDLYRLNSPQQVYDLGLEENLGNGIVLIEWPELMLDELNHMEYIHIFIKSSAETERIIELIPYGDNNRNILNKVYHEDISSFKFRQIES